MKRILLSIMTIALVATVAVGATRAYFTDTEQSLGNTFSTGTIDIAVDGENPWSRQTPYQLIDMKPSQVGYSNFTIQNVGTNPANVWKEVKNVVTSENGTNEPELAYYTEHDINPAVGKNDIDTVIEYDLSVKLKNPAGATIWYQMLYNKEKTISQIKETPMFLGMIPVGWSMDVVESYHMKADTGNWAQSDKMTFDIVLTGEQLKGTLTLLPKTGDPDWQLIYGGATGTLNYGVKDATFNYTFNASGLTASTSYSLIHYVDPWPGNGTGVIGLLGSGTTDGSGSLTLSGNTNLGANMINAKVWLVLSSDYDSTTTSMTAWNPTNYLFEIGLIDYYDSDL